MLCALYATYLGYMAAKSENRKSTDSYLQACGFLSFLLGTTAMFDVLAIVDSMNDNYTMCSLSHGSKLTQWTREGNPCSLFSFYFVSLFCFASAAAVFMSRDVFEKFRKSIALDGL